MNSNIIHLLLSSSVRTQCASRNNRIRQLSRLFRGYIITYTIFLCILYYTKHNNVIQEGKSVAGYMEDGRVLYARVIILYYNFYSCATTTSQARSYA